MSSRSHLIVKLAKEQQPHDNGAISSEENGKVTVMWKIKAPNSNTSVDALDVANENSIPMEVHDREQGLCVKNTFLFNHIEYNPFIFVL